ncbi:hypothetical protein M513_12343, partial [Trichuris suis]
MITRFDLNVINDRPSDLFERRIPRLCETGHSSKNKNFASNYIVLLQHATSLFFSCFAGCVPMIFIVLDNQLLATVVGLNWLLVGPYPFRTLKHHSNIHPLDSGTSIVADVAFSNGKTPMKEKIFSWMNLSGAELRHQNQ